MKNLNLRTMENELNYLSEKIEDITESRDYHEREAAKAESEESRSSYNEAVLRENTELEILNSIMSVVTEQALT